MIPPFRVRDGHEEVHLLTALLQVRGGGVDLLDGRICSSYLTFLFVCFCFPVFHLRTEK